MFTEERRHQIVVAAADLFDTRGYANTSIDFAPAVSVAKSVLYYYFRSEEESLKSTHE